MAIDLTGFVPAVKRRGKSDKPRLYATVPQDKIDVCNGFYAPLAKQWGLPVASAIALLIVGIAEGKLTIAPAKK